MKRRDFAESVLTAALAPLLGGASAVGAPGWWETAAARTVPSVADDLDAQARALTGVVRARYGSRFTEPDLATITRQIRNALERAQQMRKVDLANGDEPDSVFAAPGEPTP